LKKKTGDRVTILEQQEIPPNQLFGFRVAESTNIYNAIVNSCKNAGMWLTDEDEMIAKKKFNEGKIDQEELNKILGRVSDDEDTEEVKDIREDDP
jgi:hypothetical protein